MRKFDYTFLHDGLLPAELVNLTANIYEIKNTSNLRKKDFPKVFTELEKIAKIQSVKSSNAIEGIVTSDKRIEKIVNQNSAPINHNEAEIVGYRDALNSIHLEYENIEFTERNIINLHNILLSSANYEFAGRYKTENNLILEIDADGERNVRFKPISATQTPKAMEQMCLAYTAAASDSNINQLLLIPCVILDFLCIHPFRDGNGRMSRLLSLLLLYKNGFDIGKYVSFEEQINKYKDSYYDALKQSSQGWENGENSYIPFIRNFLSMLYMCYKELNKRFAVIDSKRITKTSRIEAVIFNSLIPVSKAEISSMLLDVSPSTVESVLGKLVKSGSIKKIGSGKNTKYIKK